MRVASNSPSTCWPCDWTVTSSSSPPAATTTTLLSGRTFTAPSAGDTLSVGAATAGLSPPPSAVPPPASSAWSLPSMPSVPPSSRRRS